jgi:hypothetical protein
MSVSGISTTSLFNVDDRQQFKQEFQQLGQDLQAGDLSAAQQDFATLQSFGSQSQSGVSSASMSNNPILQQFNQLSQDLQSGNLSAAQQDYTKLQQDFQQMAARHHHHHGGGGSSTLSQLFQQLGQALQSGNGSSAQEIFATMQRDMQQLGQSSGQNAMEPSTQSSSGSVSVSA